MKVSETITPIVNDHGSSSESTPPPAPPRPLYRRPQWLVLMAIAAVVVIVVGGRYLLHAWAHESTDDAFVDAHVVAIAPKVASYVGAVQVDDNQHVNKGDLLVELDARDFDARLAQARADLAATFAQHSGASVNVRVVDTTSSASVRQAEAGVQMAQRQVDGARSQLERSRAQVVAA